MTLTSLRSANRVRIPGTNLQINSHQQAQLLRAARDRRLALTPENIRALAVALFSK